ncbi:MULTISPECIES: hypothetical protein [Atopobiaceae]|uniref:Uncharacterized protein n=1 Tax=Parafannyhessea umbonata TaxID=604330 RepID=A0A1H9NYT2_9ACTN|nr:MULTISPECIES: hypothetical protein [Atopobiaceae]SEH68845.1 hypothetical protein SAMN05216447_11323 [Parafannyhessea umbonata]SER41021.1 hypothetical protein SAMN05216446_0693 [Parafannyhessea umbonata]SJZ53894.1 hypothetical protein SAMN06298223_0640 [Olsenella sp. KH1P3]
MTDQQNRLLGAVVALGATIADAMDDAPGFTPCATPAQMILVGLRTCSAQDDTGVEQRIAETLELAAHVADHRGVAVHTAADVESFSPAQRRLADELQSRASAADIQMITETEVAWLYRALAALEGDDDQATRLLA